MCHLINVTCPSYIFCCKGFPTPKPPVCMSALGLQSGQVLDASMTASSIACQPYYGRLFLHSGGGKTGGWCAAANDVNQWFQVDFGKYAKIQRISTQGRQESAQWVTSYILSYSQDGVFFKDYRANGELKVRFSKVF